MSDQGCEDDKPSKKGYITIGGVSFWCDIKSLKLFVANDSAFYGVMSAPATARRRLILRHYPRIAQN